MSFRYSSFVANKVAKLRRRSPAHILLLLATTSFLAHSHACCFAQNLIINGDFSAGNVGFTTDYVFTATDLRPAGAYTVGTNPSLYHDLGWNYGDHTTGDGLMFIANGTTQPNQTVWSQDFVVSPDTTYIMSAWVATWGSNGNGIDTNPPQFQFSFNGDLLGASFTASMTNGEWTQFSANWFSGQSTTVNIRIVNNTLAIGGNDFSLDDLSLTVDSDSAITNSYPYHSSYTGSGTPPWNRIDTSKILVKEGTEPQLLTYNNLINTAQGINGIVFDIENLPDAGNLSVEDFEFQMSPTGAFDGVANPPANWQLAPAPSSISVTPGSPDRVLIQWADQSIMNRWLRITVLANEETGLAQPETYYIGHLLGETTGPSDGTFTVSFADITSIRAEVGQTVDASSITDIDKNGTVSFADISAMRGNVGAQLTQISVP